MASHPEGQLWLLRCRKTHSHSVAKLVPTGAALGSGPGPDPGQLKRDLQLQARLSHVNIAELKQVILSGRTLASVMSYEAGGDLHTFCSKFRLEEDYALYFFRQIMSALEYCRSHGVVHREVKLSSFLLTTESPPRLKLADFGCGGQWASSNPLRDKLARASATFQSSRLGRASATLQQTGKTAKGRIGAKVSKALGGKRGQQRDGRGDAARGGEARRMAPHALESAFRYAVPGGASAASEAADVWSCGVLLAQLIMGRHAPVWLRPDALEPVMGAWAGADPVAARLASRLSPELRDLLDGMLAAEEGSRITFAGIADHPWFARQLPDRLNAALEAMAEEQELRDTMPRAAVLAAAGRHDLRDESTGEYLSLNRVVDMACTRKGVSHDSRKAGSGAAATSLVLLEMAHMSRDALLAAPVEAMTFTNPLSAGSGPHGGLARGGGSGGDGFPGPALGAADGAGGAIALSRRAGGLVMASYTLLGAGGGATLAKCSRVDGGGACADGSEAVGAQWPTGADVQAGSCQAPAGWSAGAPPQVGAGPGGVWEPEWQADEPEWPDMEDARKRLEDISERWKQRQQQQQAHLQPSPQQQPQQPQQQQQQQPLQQQPLQQQPLQQLQQQQHQHHHHHHHQQQQPQQQWQWQQQEQVERQWPRAQQQARQEQPGNQQQRIQERLLLLQQSLRTAYSLSDDSGPLRDQGGFAGAARADDAAFAAAGAAKGGGVARTVDAPLISLDDD